MRLELFWYGMRDYFQPKERGLKAEEEETLASTYSELFPRLREEIEGSGKFRKLQPHNYVSKPDWRERLRNNLLNTEIDIVLQSPSHLFIGEAKHESTFGANSDDVLTHQLIRQYVMARILLKLCGDSRKVVPFVVGDHDADIDRRRQVEFTVDQGWMREENILEWSDIEALW